MNIYSLLCFVLLSITFVIQSAGQSQKRAIISVDKSEIEIVRAINTIRAQGCRCGIKRYSSASRLSWNDKLEDSSFEYARHMSKYKHFDHVGRDGSKVGDRVDRAGYFWRLVGENIGEGQNFFHEVLKDWMLSPSHCQLIMDPKMQHVAVSRYNKYWVLHMAAPMPVDHKRGEVRYKN